MLYIKATLVCVCVGSAWKILPVTAFPVELVTNMLFPVELVTNRVGRPGQPLRGAMRGAISIKEILEEIRGPASNQTKIQFF
jgi:hypothetical protein